MFSYCSSPGTSHCEDCKEDLCTEHTMRCACFRRIILWFEEPEEFDEEMSGPVAALPVTVEESNDDKRARLMGSLHAFNTAQALIL